LGFIRIITIFLYGSNPSLSAIKKPSDLDGFFVFAIQKGIRTREGFGVKKTVWYTVFSQKSLSGSDGRLVCKAQPPQTENPSLSAIKKPSNLDGFFVLQSIDFKPIGSYCVYTVLNVQKFITYNYIL
ncbi:MAG: hypothetical protein J6C76_04975, partial [Oscillospiraceae bacterium]|nr:hypothetical protein [Oscillospiraceae bacterium]